ncbi:MAG: hypothetical protein ACFB02_05075 [Mastigocoleus sp.]
MNAMTTNILVNLQNRMLPHKKEFLSLGERVFNCENCGFQIDTDKQENLDNSLRYRC